MLKCKMHSLNLTEIHLSYLTLLWFNWVFYVSNLFNSCLLSNFVKKLPLRKLTKEKRIFEKQILTSMSNICVCVYIYIYIYI